jgi:hypothetical protein
VYQRKRPATVGAYNNACTLRRVLPRVVLRSDHGSRGAFSDGGFTMSRRANRQSATTSTYTAAALTTFLTAMDLWRELNNSERQTPRMIATWTGFADVADLARECIDGITKFGPDVVRAVHETDGDSELVLAWINAQYSWDRDAWAQRTYRAVRHAVEHALILTPMPETDVGQEPKGKAGRRGYPLDALAYAKQLRTENPSMKAVAIRKKCLDHFSEDDLPPDPESFRRWMNRKRANRAN